MKQHLDDGKTVKEVKVDLRMSSIKPIHFIMWLSQQEGALIGGWKQTGILESVGNHS